MKSAIVTGASSGIGLEIKRQLEIKGYKVFGTSRKDHRELYRLDVRSKDSIIKFKEDCCLDGLDLLVNNAGIFPEKSNILECDPIDVRYIMETNVLGPLLMIQEFWEQLKIKQGRVVNVSSVHGLTTKLDGSRACYSLSKSCLNHITRLFALEGVPHSININACCPGHCKTRMGGDYAPINPDQAADTPVWLGTEAPEDLTGKFFIKREAVPW